MALPINIARGTYDGEEAVFLSFSLYGVKGIMSTTKEYNLVYIPKSNTWAGDVISCGEWIDLGEEAILELRTLLNLDNYLQLLCRP